MKHTTAALYLASAVFVLSPQCQGQFIFEPEGAHADLFFPHLADGGSASFKFQTAITLLNPATSPANVTLSFFQDDGSPLAINFGAGPISSLKVTIPPVGTTVLRSSASSVVPLTGWALGISDTPLQGTVQFRAIANGVPQQEVSALATVPAVSYVSPATALTGIALVNLYKSSPQSLAVTVFDSLGATRGTTTVTVPPNGHRSFNLNALFPALTTSFAGSLKVVSTSPQQPYFVGWTLSVSDSGILSSYPPGPRASPIDHVTRIRDVYAKTIKTADLIFSPTLSALGYKGISLTSASVPLRILENNTLNAFATRADNSISIELALSELISDSPSELAYVIGHEIGHIIQYKTGRNVLGETQNAEEDADLWGMVLALFAGYDPYGAAGALAKISMANDQSSLLSQNFDNMSGDLHGSFNNRISRVYNAIKEICDGQVAFCADYKQTFHPHFPRLTPLFKEGIALPRLGSVGQ